MNDRPTSGQYPDFGYDGLSTTTFAGDQAYASYETQGQGYQFVTDYAAPGSYGTYDAYGTYPAAGDTGSYDTTGWSAPESYLSSVPAQTVPEDTTGQYDASAWNTATAEYQPAPLGYDSAGTEQTGHWTLPGYGQDTGTYDATAWNGGAADAAAGPGYEATTVVPVFTETAAAGDPHESDAFADAGPYADADPYADEETSVFEPVAVAADEEPELTAGPVHDMPTQAMPVTPAAAGPRAGRRATGKSGSGRNAAAKGGGSATAGSRRRTPAKRSALLTVAVPSACVMGVAGVAAASVGGLTGSDKPAGETTTMAAPDPSSVKPVEANNKLDTQLAALSADAGDFADRASRTQERIDLKQRQEEEKKKRAEEAAAKEAARPKFAVPVAQHGLSAMFGQAGGMWMSVHTGIDFPVGYGTPVMAATDGTMRTQWNSAYGNMAILTSPDGTETWYCHLSSTKIRSGQVKAGDVIAYSGNSGNSTGPHLHFEVRPGGGSAVDPLAWLRSHGLDPS
ncbi:M23 family metallopeptidase [Streptomyces sp. W1SF4]|uniref:M23 family metallopeptidase n=1 Tax=Streptomyces sp. W1SF4 TaxID=2305220 RepID=UPI000F712BB3|nr:M23 family metallopeptidase [Streptomyces sp. W1SF4]AZM90687.1 M23 family peptidase [Streptomyces sp. W1SF4]